MATKKTPNNNARSNFDIPKSISNIEKDVGSMSKDMGEVKKDLKATLKLMAFGQLKTLMQGSEKSANPENKPIPSRNQNNENKRIPEQPKLLENKQSANWEVVDDFPMGSAKRAPRLPGPKSPLSRLPVPAGGASAGIGALGATAAVAGTAAVLGGMAYLGSKKESQLPETEIEAQQRGVALSKENQIFSENPKGLAQVLDEQEKTAKDNKDKSSVAAAPTRNSSTTIQFSEAKFAETDPENYKKFVEFKNKRYKEIIEQETKKGYSEATAKEFARQQAKIDAIEKFKKEIEAAGSSKNKKEETQVQPESQGVQSNQVQPEAQGQESPQAQKTQKSYDEIYQEELKHQKGFGTEEQQKIRATQTARLRYRAQGSSDQVSSSEVRPSTKDEAQVQPSKDEAQVQPSKDEAQVQQAAQKKPKSYDEIYQEELKHQKGFGTEEQQKLRAAQTARLRYRAQDATSSSETSNVQPDKSASQQPGVSSKPDRAEEQANNLRAVAAQQGMTGKVSGTYEGGHLTKVRDESGREVDVSDQLTSEQKKRVAAARELRAAMDRTGELQNQVSQSSAENRDLNRETNAGSTTPVVIQNNNNMASQNYVPIAAQPRLGSSFSRYQERTAVY